jgi:malto-oligosyltrehalose trehalohydrolase
LLDPRTNPPQGKFRAQWNDDYHHAWHVLLTREGHGYYEDYVADPGQHIARALSSGFAYQGETSPHRAGRRRGEPSGALPPTAFVNFLQNHDQIGNRALGDRLSTQADERALEAALAVTLLAPMPPLLFMGEEWGSKRPFPFFCDFNGALAEAVRKGRREEFKSAYAKLGDDIPDPLDEDTFRSAVLDWNARETPEGSARLKLVRDLLTTRRREIAPRLAGAKFGSARFGGEVLIADWMPGESVTLQLAANLSNEAVRRPDNLNTGRIIWGDGAPEIMPPWSVVWTIGAR